MLQKLQKRSTAAIITICVVLLSVLLGSAISLNRLRADAVDVFYTGTVGNWRGIYDDLNEIANNSANLVTVAERYMDANDMRLDSVQRASDSFYYASTPKAMHTAAEDIREAVSALDAHLRTLPLDDADRVYHEKLVANIESGYRLIDRSGYNEAARAFNDQLRAFPANIMSAITGVKPLELYE